MRRIIRTRSFCRLNVLDCLKSEPKYSLQGKNNLEARNTQSNLNIFAIFLMLHVSYMAGFVTPVTEKHSRRYSHAGMQAWEENNTSLEDSYFEYMSTIRNLKSQESFLFNL